jgi:integrase/recombinase XerD
MSNLVAPRPAASVAHREQPASLYAPTGERKYVNLEERRRVIASSRGLDDDHALFLLTLIWTGARVSEVLALRPAAFQLDPGSVSVITLKRRVHHVREVPLPPTLLRALDRHFGIAGCQRDATAADERLWPWHRSTAWRLVKKAMTWSQVTGRPACPRGLRHGFGTGALQAGVPLNLLQRWMGHARMTTTAIYADAMGPEERLIAERFWRI